MEFRVALHTNQDLADLELYGALYRFIGELGIVCVMNMVVLSSDFLYLYEV